MPLFLTSLTLAGLADWLGRPSPAEPLALVVNASRSMVDGDEVVAMAEAELRAQRLNVRRLDVLDDHRGDLARAPAIVMSGGDPFRLLADLREAGADHVLRDAHARGVPIAGQSAGAIVCGPSVAPITLTSPFEAPADLDLKGLGLTDTLVLPHQDRPGRAARHRQAALSFAATHTLAILWDDEVLLAEQGTIVRGRWRTRRAGAEDVSAVARVFHEATLQAWSPFLGFDRLTGADLDLAGWSARIASGGHRFLVTEDELGVAGFVGYRQAADAASANPAGEVHLLYTDPRVWGAGIGQRLLERATWNLLCEGFHEAVLWTEARNDRPRRFYRRGGWVPDGAVDERDYLGVPIRNLRHRIDLTRHAGGGQAGM